MASKSDLILCLDTLKDQIEAIESMLLVQEPPKKLVKIKLKKKPQLDPTNLHWVYAFPGENDGDFKTSTSDIKGMLTDIRDWYDLTATEPWTDLEGMIKAEPVKTWRLAFRREGRKTIIDFNPETWMVEIGPKV